MPDILDSIIKGMKANPQLISVTAPGVTLPFTLPFTFGAVRIYRDEAPRSAVFPYIVASYVDDLGTGDSNSSNYGRARIQCSCYVTTGKDYAAFQLSKLVKKYLHNMINTNLYGSEIIRIEDAGGRPDKVEDVDPRVYMYHRDFMVQYKDF
jgi:hypothetical protein